MKPLARLAAALMIAPLMTGGCAVPEKPAAASPLCAFDIRDASAWVNRMPGPGGPPGNLIVALEVTDDGISRRFEPQGLTSGTLRLDVVEWGPEAGLGKIVHRARGPAPTRVEIFCQGQLVTTIEDVTIAQ